MTPIKSTIFILGSSGFAKELSAYIYKLFKAASTARFGVNNDVTIKFVDDYNPDALSIEDYHSMVAKANYEYYSIMGSGHCEIKLAMLDQIKEPILSFVHPKAINYGKVDAGCVIAPGAVIAPNVTIGKHVLVNYNATIGHDTIIGDCSVVAPNASVGGNCRIGKAVYIGSNAAIKENITIGDGATIGMGSVVTKNVPANKTIINVNEILK